MSVLMFKSRSARSDEADKNGMRNIALCVVFDLACTRHKPGNKIFLKDYFYNTTICTDKNSLKKIIKLKIAIEHFSSQKKKPTAVRQLMVIIKV